MKENILFKKISLTSVKDESILRKFTIFFVIMSFIPLLIIFIIYKEIDFSRFSLLDKTSFGALLLFLFFAALAGFWGTRRMLISILRITKAAQEVTEGKLGEDIKVKEKDELGELAHSFNEITRRLEKNIEQLKSSKKILQDVLFRVSSGVSSTRDIGSFLDLIIETIVNALDGDVGALLLLEPQTNELYVRSSYGIDKNNAQAIRIKIGEEAAGWVMKQAKPLLVPKLASQEEPVDPKVINLFRSPLICVPLVYQDRVIGTLSVSGRKNKENFNDDDLILLSNLASQTSVALENARLSEDMERTYFETVSALAIAVEAKDPYNRGHSQHVAEYSVKIAQYLNLDKETIEIVKNAAMLHDIGKIGIGDEVLKKPSELTDEERQVMHNHPLIGESIIRPIHSLARLLDPIKHHHEFLNGSGYPDHLKGDDIPLTARILAVADSFDAMTANRPYRKGMSFEEAKQELKKYSGIYYDPKVVEAFCSVV
ncbi:MAG: HD domain-containing phosphohydrolase [Candidatus Omnitrophota bacterium]